MGVDGYGLAYPLHHPTTYGSQTRVQSSLFNTALLYFVTKLLLMGSLPKWAHILWLLGWGIESFGRCHLVQSPSMGWCIIQTVTSRG
jgi:hypothetical protein